MTASCGSDPGKEKTAAKDQGTAPRSAVDFEAAELIPGDLDLVLRVDVARMKASLGPDAARSLSKRAFQREDGAEPGEEELVSAIEQAGLVWVGLRLSDWEAGDRVIVVEGKAGDALLDRSLSYRRLPSQLEGVSLWERVESDRRASISRVVRTNPALLLFSSPVEVDSVMRVLQSGPDIHRGDPKAVGLVSLDLRPSKFSASLKKKFPSITSLLEGVLRVRAQIVPSPEGLRLNAVIDAKNKSAGTRVFRFIAAFRDNVSSEKNVELFRGLELEPLGEAVNIRWTLPLSTVAGWLGEAKEQETPADKP